MNRTPSMTAGYVILGLLGLSDALGFLLQGGEDAPPLAVNVVSTVLGVATLWALFSIVRAHRQGNRPAPATVRTLAIARILSVLTSLPAFFVDIDVSIKVVVGVAVVLTLVGLSLIRPLVAQASAGGAPATA